MDCDFSIPLMNDGNPPTSTTDLWQYSHAVCTSASTEQISNSNIPADFYLKKSVDYGQILIIIFLFLMFVFGAVKFVWNYHWQDPKQKL